MCLGHHSWSGASDWQEKFNVDQSTQSQARRRKSTVFYTLSAHWTVADLFLNEHHRQQDNSCYVLLLHTSSTPLIADAAFRSRGVCCFVQNCLTFGRIDTFLHSSESESSRQFRHSPCSVRLLPSLVGYSSRGRWEEYTRPSQNFKLHVPRDRVSSVWSHTNYSGYKYNSNYY